MVSNSVYGTDSGDEKQQAHQLVTNSIPPRCRRSCRGCNSCFWIGSPRKVSGPRGLRECGQLRKKIGKEALTETATGSCYAAEDLSRSLIGSKFPAAQVITGHEVSAAQQSRQASKPPEGRRWIPSNSFPGFAADPFLRGLPRSSKIGPL